MTGQASGFLSSTGRLAWWIISCLHLAAGLIGGRPEWCTSLGDFTKPGLLVYVLQLYNKGNLEAGAENAVDDILQDFAQYVDQCPPAALQALLVKLEENMVYDNTAFVQLMGRYTRELHAAMRQGKLTPEDLQVWPLEEGVRRVTKMAEKLAEHRNISSAMVLNYCSPQDRYGTVHQLDWILKPPFGPKVEDEVSGLLLGTDLYIYLLDMKKCTPPPEAWKASLRPAVRNLYFVSYTGGPGREEQSSYFKYIVDHYDHMPDFTIFVHPDAPEHQGAEFKLLRRVLQLLATQSQYAYDSIGYLPLAMQMLIDPTRVWAQDYKHRWREFWSAVFGPNWSAKGQPREAGTATALLPPECIWQKEKQHYLPGLLDETIFTSIAEAKRYCLAFDGCTGVTCGGKASGHGVEEEADDDDNPGSGNKYCTLRNGAPELLQRSPFSSEFTLVRRCGQQMNDLNDQGPLPIVQQPGVLTMPEPRPGEPGAPFRLYTGSQSIIRADRIRSRPKSDYVGHAAALEFCSEHTGLYEAVWHYMFGEPLAQWPRASDPGVALYLKWRGFTWFFFGDEGVI
eukprot:TRINITY_DN28908_c0_g1_i1.p1 TRINITY_DN28908_c0_g1~~TRINITY_DN28908_c0_g1_i1.p1  ORF type:complete len:566 (+),score=86.76 TRINITY_DN28908_c0_g1_i1:113-1810(+)